ncbi:DUF6056 family protein [Streptomyces chryseus]|uniref:Integral membrane protein n=1 Tax=Streptomyces chryseus TaxID=68186 RepID=A0ABQ3EI62_9ACTN|nr:DUF6056 family protein [Streptomyces chryseus]GGX42459.1 hypothetical protein GCM10010353_67060 [Streptomyces chryseus]GHB31554.1 hypothetical protein GCM10010346_63670 [Streptomyces chryseus]
MGSFLGLYVQPTSDDWCSAWRSRELGILGIANEFYEIQNGRIANGVVAGVVYAHGVAGPKLLPSLLVLSFLAGLFLLARTVFRLLGWEVPPSLTIAAAAVVCVLLFFAGASPYQALLWAPSTISHTLPGLLTVWSSLVALAAARHGRLARGLALVFAMVMGVAIGTLSEPFTIVSGVFAVGAVAVLLRGLRFPRDRYPVSWCLMWCAGLAIGFVLLYTSPGAAWRRAQQPQRKSPLSPTELTATVQDWLSIWASVGGQWAYLAAAAAGLMLGLAAATSDRTIRPVPREPETGRGGARRRPWLLMLLPVLLMGMSSFGVAFGLRMGYGPTGWTYVRTWTSFLFPMLLLLCAYGALAGRALAGWQSSVRRPRPVVFAATTTAVLASAASLWAVAGLVPAVKVTAKDTVTRSVDWDRQDRLVREKAAQGSKVVPYRPLPIGGLSEPFATTNYSRDWVARCVSGYYRVERIERPAPKRSARIPHRTAGGVHGSPASRHGWLPDEEPGAMVVQGANRVE